MVSPCVQTTSGLMQGCVQDDVRCFLGIPYAKPPVGALRFLPPQSAVPYEGVYDATFFRDSPVQFRGGAASAAYRQDQQNQPPLCYSEDCLYLNIWAPKQHTEPLPVVFWIYGGAYAMGSSSMETYNGTAFAKQGIVVVSINYRVGIFGFLAHPMLDKHAPHAYNAGLWDLIAGLEWVRDNIANFGGDPNNVTIQGESAGSAAVNTLLLCPQAKGLFHRAISQSFSPFNHDEWAHDKADMQDRCLAFLKTLGIQTEEELLSAPAEKLLGRLSEYMAVGFSPYVDGVLLNESLEQAFLNGHFHDVPVLLGCTTDEATSLIGEPAKVTEERFMATLRFKYADYIGLLLDTYRENLAKSPADALSRFRSDNTLANMRFYAAALCSRRSPVYFYLFSRVIPGVDSDFYRAYHAGEIPYHFGNLKAVPRPFTQEDEQLSSTMMAYWASFARNGDPNAEGLPQWEKYDPNTDRMMHLDVRCECTGIQNRELIDFLMGLLRERTKKINPNCPMPV